MKSIKAVLAISSLLIFSNIYSKIEKTIDKKDSDFKQARQGGEKLNFIESDLSNLRTKGYNLIGAKLPEADLTNANLRNSRLDGAILNGATMINAQLQRANLAGAHLEKAILNQAKLNQAFLQGTNFAGANLTNADFSNYDSRSYKARFKDLWTWLRNFRTVLKTHPSEQNPIDTNFEQVKAINTKFINVILIGANFYGANLAGAKFNNSILASTYFSEVKSLQGTDFSGAILFRANFDDTSFEGAIVKGANFYGVELTPAQKEYLKKNGAFVDDATVNGVTLPKQDIRNFFKPMG